MGETADSQKSDDCLKMPEKIILYGNGGHAKVVAEMVHQLGYSLVGSFDKEHPYNPDFHPNAKLIIAIGNNETRQRISEEVKHEYAILIHPAAVIAENVIIGKGSVVLANAVIQTDAYIGKHCIINAGAIIDHEAVVEDFVSIYPGAYIGGNAMIARLKIIHPNQVVEPGGIYE